MSLTRTDRRILQLTGALITVYGLLSDLRAAVSKVPDNARFSTAMNDLITRINTLLDDLEAGSAE